MGILAHDFTYLQGVVRERSAIVLDAGKEYLAESRLTPLARSEGCASIAELLERLRKEPKGLLGARIVEAMTTNETSFFRDLQPFEALRTVVLPVLIARRASQKVLRIWCAASSSGQEPFSIAMTVREHFPLDGWTVDLLATDLSIEMLRRARRATYSQLEVNRGLPAKHLVRYFEQRGAEWQLASEVRDLVRFEQLNLARPLPALPPQDVVFLRNVLIYFEVETKRKILDGVHRVLQPDGYLFLGGSETTLGLDDRFERTQVGSMWCYRKRT